MSHWQRGILVFVLAGLCLGAGESASKSAMETVRETVDEILSRLEALPDERAEQRDAREAIVKVVEKVFDFEELSRRALARHWYQFSGEQQERFVMLFKELLRQTYMDRIEKKGKAVEVRYLRELTLAEGKAEVQTEVIADSKATPVFYRLHRMETEEGKGWRVYDVLIENVSLVRNYRSQFDELLHRGSPEQLLKRLQAKVKSSAK